MEILDNPVYNALLSGDALKGSGSEHVKYFHKEISPFAGFDDHYKNGFQELYQMLPAGRNILYATRTEISTPKGWKLFQHIAGTQFVLSSRNAFTKKVEALIPLEINHVYQMIELAKLTKPGPFDIKTIEFGSYYGIFDKDKLVAMTGQRLHPYDYSEVSAVCTHPDYLGKGYAAALIDHQLEIILKSGKVPFLHVKADNERAIALYDRIGFRANGKMNFYFLKKMEE